MNKLYTGPIIDTNILVSGHYRKAIQKACTSKRTYYSEQEAKNNALYVRSVLGVANVHAYPCKYCQNWHIGHKYD